MFKLALYIWEPYRKVNFDSRLSPVNLNIVENLGSWSPDSWKMPGLLKGELLFNKGRVRS